MTEFEVGAVPFNAGGWGPSETPSQLLPNHPPNVPFRSFNCSEKLGGIADWTRNYNNNKNRNTAHGSVFDSVLVDDDDATTNPFHEVIGKAPARPKFVPRWRFQHQRQLPQRRDEEVEAKKREQEKERARRDRLYNRSGNNNYHNSLRESLVFKSPVDIQPEWNMLDQIPFSSFSKLSFSVQEPEDLLVCGALETYDRSYDRINPKNEKRLERFKNMNFFKRVGNKLFFDKRDGSQLDLFSVNETCQEVALPEAKKDINSAYSLSVEAAYINQNFSQQVLVRNGSKVEFDEPNPFAGEGEEVASAAYRYRRWKLDDGMFLVARCEVQSASESNEQQSFMTLNALN
ncbi:hypothetical protein MKW98_029392 [Papaver atlanticum]|uniref:Uncharacterized protein n=1 Tax=Papaver atlanticum TaxID=357466 RepID=A0AAD4SKR5_9MAGN|nr:hypothetical protein MKW98_029392 [Papaver atlanticum]